MATAKQRQRVLNKFGGACAYCGSPITLKSMQVDHMHPQYLREHHASNTGIDVDALENLMPSCRTCNHYKRGSDLEGFRRTMITLHERVSSIYIVKVAIAFNLAEIKQFNSKFYFERLKDGTDRAGN